METYSGSLTGVSKSAPTAMKDGETTLTDTQHIFEKHFSTLVHQYLPTTNQTPDLETLQNFVNSKIPDDNLLTIPLLT